MMTEGHRRTARFGRTVALAGFAIGLAGLPVLAADTLPQRVNRGLVELITGGSDTTALRLGGEISDLLDDGGTRRILTIVGKGAVQNVTDLRALRGIDLAIVQVDVLQELRHGGQAGIETSLPYVARLHNEEFHLLARTGIARLEDLAGKPVNVGPPGDGTAVTAAALFRLLQIPVEPTTFDHTTALAKLRAGELAAIAVVTGKPAPAFATVRADDGLHFLAVPLKPELLAAYAPARLTAEDYPGLIAADEPVDSMAVGTVLLAANLVPESERYRNLVQFVDAFFTQFPKLLEPPHHPKWHEVNLAADLPGWRRFPTAAAWLQRNNVAVPVAAPNEQQLREIFSRFLDERTRATSGKPLDDKEKDQMFEQFRQWRSSQAR